MRRTPNCGRPLRGETRSFQLGPLARTQRGQAQVRQSMSRWSRPTSPSRANASDPRRPSTVFLGVDGQGLAAVPRVSRQGWKRLAPLMSRVGSSGTCSGTCSAVSLKRGSSRRGRVVSAPPRLPLGGIFLSDCARNPVSASQYHLRSATQHRVPVGTLWRWHGMMT